MEGGSSKTQKTQTGTGQPQIALIVKENVVDGVVEAVGVDGMKGQVLIKVADTAV